MSRNGSGVYSLPAGSAAVDNAIIDSVAFNTLISDLESDANTARPIVAGGTGATTAAAARTNLGVAYEKIEKGTLSASSGFAFLIPSDMDRIEILAEDVVPSINNGQVQVQVGTGTLGSPTWITASSYNLSFMFQSNSAPNFSNATQTAFNLSVAARTTGVLPNVGRLTLSGFNGAAGINALFDYGGVTDVAGTATNQTVVGTGRMPTAGNYTIARLIPSSGTFSCRYSVLGFRK